MLADVLANSGLELRPARVEDDVFAEQLFRSTRKYLTQILVDSQFPETLIQQQFQWQQRHYKQLWPDAKDFIIYFSMQPVGKLTLNETANDLHIIDFIIAEKMRGKGLGTSLLRALQAVAKKQSLALRLSVDCENLSARRLYLALGFKVVTQTDTQAFMVWPQGTPLKNPHLSTT